MPRQRRPKIDADILEMAIIGYQNRLETVSAEIDAIKARLGKRGPGRPKTIAGTRHQGPDRKPLSAAARARIAAAQRVRWAAYKKDKAKAT